MRKIILLLIMWGLPSILLSADPTFNNSLSYYPNIKYFFNEYTRQYDGVYFGAIASSDSARLGGQLPSYYATSLNLGNEITSRINGDKAIGVSTGTIQSQLNTVQSSTFSITAGTGIYVSPSSGQGNVTVSALTQNISKWTVAGRPASPVVGESFGYNITYSGIEIYTSYGWYIYGGIWTTVGRPVAPALGSTGYNTTIGSREYYDGSGPDGWNQA